MASQARRLQAAPGVAQELRRRSRSTTISARDRERATIILLRLEGIGVDETARRLNTTPKRVSVWSRRFAATGLPGLDDRAGRGRKPSIPAAKVAQVITEATRPVAGRSRWSIRSMGRHAGISPPCSGDRAVLRREKPVSGPGTHATRTAAGTEAVTHHDP